MSSSTSVGGHVHGFGKTRRTDAWWLGPAASAVGVLAWLAYIAWASMQGEYYAAGPYISPLYEPMLFVDPTRPGSAGLDHALIGTWPSWWPAFIPASGGMLFAWVPGMFRMTCYYYRKMYYRSFFGTPPGCAVGPIPQASYKGETFLLVFHNLHRYTLYGAIAMTPVLFYGAFSSFFYHGQFGVGVGSFIMLVNAMLLTFYTFGCHAWRHLIGGKLNCFSCGDVEKIRFNLWKPSSWLNAHHLQFAWMSLGWFMLTEVYIRAVSMGKIVDLNTWGGF